MRSIASCYSDHAVKVSDSYCSGPSPHGHVVSNFAPPNPIKISSTYRLKNPTQAQFFIALHWSRDCLGRGFAIDVNSISHRFSGAKGAENFRSGGSEISLFWDLSDAIFDPGPDPTSGFYLVVTVDSEIGLFLGDEEEELTRLGILKPKSKTQMANFSLVSRSEQFSGDGSVFSTKARFSDSGSIHDISVKWRREEDGRKEQVLMVLIDRKKIFEVNRLRWNFRGNQTVFLDGLVVDVMWDVHDWFFRPKSGFAAFMFRTRSGLDSRLWFAEKKHQEKMGFSLLIRVCKNPD